MLIPVVCPREASASSPVALRTALAQAPSLLPMTRWWGGDEKVCSLVAARRCRGFHFLSAAPVPPGGEEGGGLT